MIAENDIALGRLVDTITHSAYWKESAIFVLEDDAQNGPDHVDAHRSPALVISPFTRRRVTDSTLYTTSSVLRTMELILGLEPMSQYDAVGAGDVQPVPAGAGCRRRSPCSRPRVPLDRGQRPDRLRRAGLAEDEPRRSGHGPGARAERDHLAIRPRRRLADAAATARGVRWGEGTMNGGHASGSGFRVQGSGFKVQGSGFRVQVGSRLGSSSGPTNPFTIANSRRHARRTSSEP